MAKQVIKKGGKREAFRAAKLTGSIRAACKDIRLAALRTKLVVAKVSGPALRLAAKRNMVRAAVLRKKILAGLRKAEPAAAKAWLQYEKRRSSRRR